MGYETLDPTSWVPYLPWIGVAYIIYDAHSTLHLGSFSFASTVADLFLYAIAFFWQNQVTEIVPEPYLVCSPPLFLRQFTTKTQIG